MQKLISQNILTYTVIFEPAEEGGYIASVPALPGCLTQGETFEETVAMIKDAITGYILTLKEENQEIPQEKEDVIVTKVNIHSPQAYL